MSYSLREVSAMLGLSPAQIRAYATQGFLSPERGPRGEMRFGFQDLILLRTAGELSSAHIPQRKVRRVLESLREQLPEGRSLTGVRIAADGERVVVRDGSSLWNAESGQSLFDFAVDEIVAAATPFARPRDDDDEGLEADDLYAMACAMEETDAGEAKEVYEKALEIDPHHADAHVNLGRILHEEGAPAAAEQHYRAALEVDPKHETAIFNLGVALEDLDRIRDAVAAYRKAIDLDPKNADAHYNLAGLYERRGEKAAAVRHLAVYRRLVNE